MKVRRVDFYPDDWLVGTAMLDDAERGVYISACALIYSQGGPVGIDHLRAICRGHGLTFNRCLKRLTTLGKLTEKDGRIDQERCENELRRAEERLENAVRNGRKGGRPPKEINDLEKPDGYKPQKTNIQQTTDNNIKKESLSIERPKKHTPKPSMDVDAWQPGDAHRLMAHELGMLGEIDAESDQYRCWLRNAKRPHKDLNAGFRNWLREAARRKPQVRNGNGHAKLSPADKLFLGAARAAEAFGERERARLAAAEPLLDCGRSPGRPPGSG
jgi:uncharacterized protein YdaU (DUF1376 family)